ncbi:MAG: methionine--tRNA ligase subunit beta [Promethearchaeota archaeon]
MVDVSFKDFQELDIRIGKILNCEKIPGAKKLLKCIIDIGTEKREIIAGMAEFLSPEELVGKTIVVLVNLEPKKFMGIESQGMILAADLKGKPFLLTVESEVPAGTKVR